MIASPAAWCAPPSLVLAGSQVSAGNSYSYAGALTPLSGDTLGQGWFAKTIASWLTYRYTTTLNQVQTRVDAHVPGIEAGAGYAWSGANYHLDASADVGYRKVRLTPTIPADESKGSGWFLAPQLHANYDFTPSIDGDLIASYTFKQHSNFDRGRLGWKPSASWHVGVESVLLRGDDYRIRQNGVFASTNLDNGLALSFSLGRSAPRDESHSTYFGIALSKSL
jgi:hypothetical protein